ncbi:hypothetical protein TVAG_157800 [Trichomonas vaginalis G3]|uniref:Uncharacterized protein n=1 Tax=Trichomonas vaginalis (strain ATCC PRA-98 / G3) TaxID=412133 RepID=A2FBB5_TRIV3|nr:hypothetical protein TVAGG3_0232270 [Trichomonas vaginalis G3]EAX97795.1 hypothetical protein TVAG_157800 [Trichomonas vaginalis G3]KAI5552729.1 hypothetical protein TVAGG3_0232270 [Trichomonas vaginalis G3]|eukprot:XP_001310725.1 hypothetical protein [Trichomonas vaginalis G3]
MAEDSLGKNYVFESSFDSCKGFGSTLLSAGGIIAYLLINISYSFSDQYSGFVIGFPFENSFVNNSNFYNLTSREYIFGFAFEKHFVSHCNLIKCNEQSKAIILCAIRTYLSLSECFIKENTSPLFINIEYNAKVDIYLSLYDNNSIDQISNEPDKIHMESPQIFSRIETNYLSTVFCHAEKPLEVYELEINQYCPRLISKMNIFPLFHVFASCTNKTKSKAPKTMINLNSKIKSYKSKVESKIRAKLKPKSKTN